MSFRFPYLSIDIETTGLDLQRSHVLQLGAVYDDGSSLETLHTFNQLVRWPVITYGEDYAMHLNRHILEKIFTDKSIPTIEDVRYSFDLFLSRIQTEGKIIVAGKSVANFDIQILANPINNFNLSRFERRYLDPGNMYTEEFDHIPSQTELNKFVGRGEVSHDALEDSWDVVHAIRHKWGVRE